MEDLKKPWGEKIISEQGLTMCDDKTEEDGRNWQISCKPMIYMKPIYIG